MVDKGYSQARTSGVGQEAAHNIRLARELRHDLDHFVDHETVDRVTADGREKIHPERICFGCKCSPSYVECIWTSMTVFGGPSLGTSTLG